MLSKLSVKKPFVVVVGIILVAILGVVSYLNIGVDLLPSMNLPYIVIVTILPGATPDEVEKTLTDVVEEGLSEIANVASMTSTSAEHYSMVLLEFNYDVNVDTAYSDVKSALDLVVFPDNELLQKPMVLKINPSMLPIMTLSISRAGYSIKDSSGYLTNVINRIKAVDGVAAVSDSGLITNLAYIKSDEVKLSNALIEYMEGLINGELVLPEDMKAELQVELREEMAEIEAENGVVTPELLIEVIIEYLEENKGDLAEEENGAIIEFALDYMLRELKNPASDTYASAVELSQEIIDNRFILADGEENKAIFSDFIDQIYKNGVSVYIRVELGNALDAMTSDVLSQLIYAQDFDMPAGSIKDGELEYVLKIGTTVNSREELIDLPVVSIDIGTMIEDRINQIQALLSLLSYTNDNGEISFTEGNLDTLANQLALIYGADEEEAKGVIEDVADQLVEYIDETVDEDILTSLGTDYRETEKAYYVLNAPGKWNTGWTLDWRQEAIGLFKECFDEKLTEAQDLRLDNIALSVKDTKISSDTARILVGTTASSIADIVLLNADRREALEAIYISKLPVEWEYSLPNDYISKMLNTFVDNVPDDWEITPSQKTRIVNRGEDLIVPDVEASLTRAIEQLDPETQDRLEEMFGDMTEEEINDTLHLYLRLLERIGGTEAVKLPKAPEGEELSEDAVYTVNFVLLKERISELDERLIVPLELSSIAEITFLDDATSQITELMSKINGTVTVADAVNLSIDKEPDKSTAEITGAIKETLEALKKEDDSFNYTILSNDGDYIDFMLSAVIENLLYGAILAVVILFLFLKNLKATLVVGSSIFISVVATFVAMYFAGISLNIVSMGGLALGVGMLVDNSIVVIENIQRMRGQGKSVFVASIQGAKQVSGAIISSTLTTVIVFLPIAFIDGLTKQIFTDMALTIAFSLLCSLVVAMTLVPMSTSTFMKKPPRPEGKLMHKVKKSYAKSLNFILNHKVIPIVLILVMLGATILMVFNMETELFPDSDSGTLSVSIEIDAAAIENHNKEVEIYGGEKTSQEEVYEKALEDLKNIAASYDDIAQMGIREGSSLISFGGMSLGGGGAEATIIMVDEKERKTTSQQLTKDMTAAFDKKSGGLYSVTINGSSMMGSIGMLTSTQTVSLYGDNIDELRKNASDLVEIIKDVDGVESISDNSEDVKEEYRIVIDKSKANLYGLTVAQVYLQVSAALAEVSSSHTLDLIEYGDVNNYDVYIYSTDYVAEVWENAIDDKGDVVKIFLNNNRLTNSEKASLNEYYVVNSRDRGVYVKRGDSFTYVASGEKIPLSLGESGFSYVYADSIDNVLINYNTVSYKETDSLVYKDVSRKEEVDIMKLEVESSGLLNSSAATIKIPLYKLMDESCLLRGDNGDILYREEGLTERVPVGLRKSMGYNTISHVDKKKTVSIVLTYSSEANSNKVGKEIQGILNEYNSEKGYTKGDKTYKISDGITVGDEIGNSEVNSVFETLYLVLILAVVCIYLIMVAQFQSWKSPFIIMFTIPLAFIGCIGAIAIAQLNISVMALMGFIVLLGVVVNNGIVFVDYCNQLIEMGVPKRLALLRTGVDRLRPILMTALTTILALCTMAFDTSASGALLRPLAVATMGGLAVSTLLTLYIIPIIFDLFNRKAKQSDRAKAFLDKDIDKIDGSEVADSLSAETGEVLSDLFEGSLAEQVVKINKDIYGVEADIIVWGAHPTIDRETAYKSAQAERMAKREREKRYKPPVPRKNRK